jgi:hypothetical protein
MTIHSELPNDNYKPVTSKPSLQQYDNYQIYTVICVDKSASQQFLDFLAIQTYSPFTIDCDFMAIAHRFR